MKRQVLRLWLFCALGLVVAFSLAVSASSAAAPPLWANAIEVPGTAALNTYGTAQVSSVDCTTAGNCTGGGYYYDNSGREEAWVADSRLPFRLNWVHRGAECHELIIRLL